MQKERTPRKPQYAELPSTDVLVVPSRLNADELVSEFVRLDDYVTAQTAKFNEHMKPARDRQSEIKDLFLAMSLDLGCDSFKTPHGTAYKSTIVTPKISEDGQPWVDPETGKETRGRDAFLDFCLLNWDGIGNELLQVGAPQKDALKEYQNEHDGALPPGVTTTSFTRFNIRRT